MAHSRYIDNIGPDVTPADRRRLLSLARQSIEHGLRSGQPLRLAEETLEGIAARSLGSFVTLKQQGALRGCVGSILPSGPLAAGVCASAYRAAFGDPRFAPLEPAELDQTDIEISVLSALVPITFADEAELLAMLRPNIDGLVLEEGALRATFLPKVWESLPDPERFLDELKRKAGLPAGYWSATLRIFRYSAVAFGDADIAATSVV